MTIKETERRPHILLVCEAPLICLGARAPALLTALPAAPPLCCPRPERDGSLVSSRGHMLQFLPSQVALGLDALVIFFFVLR